MLRALLVAALAAFAHSTPALAELTICNDSDERRSVAVGRKADGAWGSEGWWNIKAGECKTPVKGELSQRYYYYRAVTGGRAIHGGAYSFCTTSKAFTIVGQDECAARGHKRETFERIDTGSDARSFTFRLPEPPQPKAADEPPAVPPPAPGFAPNTFGEAFTTTGVMQSCGRDDGGDYCAFHADGAKYFARPGAGTPARVLRAMQNAAPAQLFDVSGDLISFGDITVEAAISSFRPAAPDAYSAMREAIQGNWFSKDDPGAAITIAGAQKIDFYEGKQISEEWLRWTDACDGRKNIGPIIVATEPENRDEPLCYAVIEADDLRLVLSLIGGNGQDLTYERR